MTNNLSVSRAPGRGVKGAPTTSRYRGIAYRATLPTRINKALARKAILSDSIIQVTNDGNTFTSTGARRTRQRCREPKTPPGTLLASPKWSNRIGSWPHRACSVLGSDQVLDLNRPSGLRLRRSERGAGLRI